jgi:hypothetical protein
MRVCLMLTVGHGRGLVPLVFMQVLGSSCECSSSYACTVRSEPECSSAVRGGFEALDESTVQ